MFLAACGQQALPPKLDMRWIGRNLRTTTPINRQNMAVLGAYAFGVIALKNLDIFLNIAEMNPTNFGDQTIIPGANITAVSSTSKNSTYRVDCSSCAPDSQWNAQFTFSTDSHGNIRALNYDSSSDPLLSGANLLQLDRKSASNHQTITQTVTIPSEQIHLTNQNGIYQFSTSTTVQFTVATSYDRGQRKSQNTVVAKADIEGQLDRRNPTQQQIEITKFDVQYTAQGKAPSQILAEGEINLQAPQTTMISFSKGVPVGSIPISLQSTTPKQNAEVTVQSSDQSLYIKGEPGSISLATVSSPGALLTEIYSAANSAYNDLGL